MVTLQQVTEMNENGRIEYFSAILKNFSPIYNPVVRIMLDLPVCTEMKIDKLPVRHPELVFEYSWKKLCWIVVDLRNGGHVELDDVLNMQGAF